MKKHVAFVRLGPLWADKNTSEVLAWLRIQNLIHIHPDGDIDSKIKYTAATIEECERALESIESTIRGKINKFPESISGSIEQIGAQLSEKELEITYEVEHLTEQGTKLYRHLSASFSNLAHLDRSPESSPTKPKKIKKIRKTLVHAPWTLSFTNIGLGYLFTKLIHGAIRVPWQRIRTISVSPIVLFSIAPLAFVGKSLMNSVQKYGVRSHREEQRTQLRKKRMAENELTVLKGHEKLIQYGHTLQNCYSTLKNESENEPHSHDAVNYFKPFCEAVTHYRPNILCVESGGLKIGGVMEYVKELEDQLGSKAHEIFDGGVGASAGSIAIGALFCNTPFTADQVMDLFYHEGIDEIFKSSPLNPLRNGVFLPQYDQENLARVLHKYFNELTIKDCKKPITICTTSTVTSESVLYSTHSHDVSRHSNPLLYDVISASCSAPGFFSGRELTPLETHIDGVVSWPNCAPLGLSLSKTVYGVDDPLLLSLEPGKTDATYGEPAMPMQYAATIIDLMLSSGNAAINTNLRLLNPNFICVEPALEVPISLDCQNPLKLDHIRQQLSKGHLIGPTPDMDDVVNRLRQNMERRDLITTYINVSDHHNTSSF